MLQSKGDEDDATDCEASTICGKGIVELGVRDLELLVVELPD